MWWQKLLINIALFAIEKLVESVKTEFSDRDATTVRDALKKEKKNLIVKAAKKML